MNEPIIETCDLHHKYYKEAGSDTRCPHCLAIGLQAARAENERLIDEAHLEVRATYDSTVAQAWREKLTASEEERIHARQILVEICNVVGACTADVSLTFLTHLPGEVKARIEKEHQTAVDLFDVVAEIAQLMGIERSEPEICRKTVTAVRELVEVPSREDCPRCGEENVLLPGDNFCPICGATIIWPGDREYR